MKSEEALVLYTPKSEGTADDPTRGQVRVITKDQDDNQLMMSEGCCDIGWGGLTEEARQTKLRAMARDLVDEHGIDAAAVYQEFAKIDGWKL